MSDTKSGPAAGAPPRRPRNPFALGRYRAAPGERRFLTHGSLFYTACDEDSWSELRALEIGGSDTVLSISGSGARSLNLLLAGPERLVSVDSNPLQNHLLALKATAMRRLDYEEFVAFLGLEPSDTRVRTYRLLRDELDQGPRAFWDLNEHVVEKGVLYTGAHERFYARYIGPVIRGLRPRKVRRLFGFDDLAAQARFYEREWDTRGWRTLVWLLDRPVLSWMLLGDPCYFGNVERADPHAYIVARLRHTLTTRLAQENHFLALTLLGHYLDRVAVPPYLARSHFAKIRENLPALEIVSAPLETFLKERPPGTFDAFSLSNVSGWMKPPDFDAMLAEVARVGRPGARICYRNFLSDRGIPGDLRDRIQVLDETARELEETDIAFAYTFVVGRIAG